MQPDLGFPLFLAVTAALLAVVVVTGLRARVAAHLTCVALAIASLGATIWFAEQLGAFYDIESAGLIAPVHLTIAKVTTVAYLLPIVTGIRTLRDRSKKRAHFICAMLVLALTVLSTVTGTWMILASTRIAP